MNGYTRGREVARRVLAVFVTVAAGWLLVARPAVSGEGQPPPGLGQSTSGVAASQQPAEKAAEVPAGASGMTIYIDPQTGAILKKPAPGTVPLQLTPELQNALSTSHDGLVEVPSSVPGGGVKVDLRGRFQSPLLGTIDAHGKTKIQHLHEMPESGEKK
jgi:hypothetical protein